MSASSEIFNCITQFVENPDLDEINEEFNDITLQFERYTNTVENRQFIKISMYKNGRYMPKLDQDIYLDTFVKTYL